MRALLVKLTLSAMLVAGSATMASAVGTEPEETPAASPAPAECKEVDKTKCEAKPVECKEADKTKCPAEGDKQKQGFLDRYRAAVALIEAQRYDEALVAMRELDDGTSADVVNYIGFINRKLGKMAEAQMYYEAALHLQPNHRGALEYYGEWYVMMGRIDKAKENLTRIASLYGADTKEYEALARMIAEAPKS